MATAPAHLPRTVTTDEAVELIWEQVFSGAAPDAAESARMLWPSLRFSDADTSFLALFGLIELAEREQAQARRTPTPRPAIGYGAPHGKRWETYVALTWPYEGAEGQQKPLLEFSRVDIAAFTVAMATMENAYARRRAWGTRAAELLEEHDKERIKDLPAGALAELEQAAVEAMGRQE